MEENKNLTPDNEENTEETVEITEEVAEEAVEVAEEAVEETTEEATVEVAEIVPEETTEEAKPKKSKGGVIAAIVLVCVAIALILALAVSFFTNKETTEGTGNLYSQGFATIKGDYIYHVNFFDYRMYKTNIKTGESVMAHEEPAALITKNGNDIYYAAIRMDMEAQTSELEFKKYVDGVNDKVFFKDSEIGMPQIADGYVYYIRSVPEFHSGNSGRVYRAALKEGSVPELVCDVLCNCFYVDGNDLYYGDVDTTAFVKTTIDKAMDAIATAPLEDGKTRSSAELEAESVIQTILACPTIVGDTLYYIDCLNQYELRCYDFATKEDKSFNNGVFAGGINIYGNYLYYYNISDFCIYRMNLDGTDVIKMTAPGYGYNVVSNDKFISLEISEEGYYYISICDLEGNVIRDITFNEQYDEFFENAEIPEEEAAEGEATEEAGEETEAVAEEVTEEAETETAEVTE